MSLFQRLQDPAQVACPPHIVAAFSRGEYCDLKITCKTLVFNVHKIVVCPACDFFKKNMGFPVGKESEEQCIDLPEDDPNMICRLITYLYVGDYEPCASHKLPCFLGVMSQKPSAIRSVAPHVYSATSQCACLARGEYNFSGNTDQRLQNQVAAPLSIHADMYALGDKYQVKGLQHLAASKFKASLASHWDSPDFITAVQTVYSSTPDSNRLLRDIVVEAFMDYFGTDITKDPAIEAKLDTIDELSFALLKSWPNKTKTTEPQARPTSGSGAPLFSSAITTAATGRPLPSPFASTPTHRTTSFFGAQ